MKVCLNGKLVREENAVISIHDHGFLYGDGVYETLRVAGGKIFALDDHLKRLAQSAAGIELRLPASPAKLGQFAQKTVDANQHKEASLRITVTRGPGPHGFDPRPCKTPTWLIVSRPFHGYPARFYSAGASAAVVNVRRNSAAAQPPSIKSTSCLNNVLAKIEANRRNVFEAIMLTEQGNLAEGTVSNLFLVKRGRLFTPVLDGQQLAGVTRQLVCQIAREQGIGVTETKLGVRDLATADEVFLTSTLIGILPLTKIFAVPDDARARKLGVGAVTRALTAGYKKLLHSALVSKSNRLRGI